ncbi:MAG TPA: hypothetical protein PLH41_14545 [Accumulibacter sp.]|nr:hypothetical protein [Accumulibacter sp.]HMW64685.1 hypothetical protein [Accumulibacter sp.]HND40212.1 hypothetical protein [Accumulibacter sp.]
MLCLPLALLLALLDDPGSLREALETLLEDGAAARSVAERRPWRA